VIFGGDFSSQEAQPNWEKGGAVMISIYWSFLYYRGDLQKTEFFCPGDSPGAIGDV
jgi:hypothetical protein